MKYTEFGEMFRILRIKNRETLFDASSFLDCSSAYISSVETGKRAIPSEWYEKIVSHYNLNKTEQNELKKAIDNSATSIKIDLSSIGSKQKSMIMQLQRSFQTIDDGMAEEIIKIINKGDQNA